MNASMLGGDVTRALALSANILLLVGCASSRLDAEWVDPQFKGHSLRDAKVLVVCEAADVAIKRICQDQIAAQITALGVTPVKGAESDNVTPKPQPVAEPYLAPARDAGARAVFSMAVAPDATVVNPGPSIGFGIGGFGGGGGSYRSGGVGMSVPVGEGQVSTGYAANTTLTDVATGRLMWTAKVTTPPSKDVGAQLNDLAKATLEGAKKEGLF